MLWCGSDRFDFLVIVCSIAPPYYREQALNFNKILVLSLLGTNLYAGFEFGLDKFGCY